MKLKYYLRGLGIGIIITAVIMSITNKPQEMTDAQIKMRALELGMVEESVLADLQTKEESNDVETVDDILKEFDKEKEENNTEELSIEENQEEPVTSESENEENVVEDSIEETVLEETVDVEMEVETSEEEIVDTETEVSIEETVDTESSANKEEDINNEVVESYTIIKVERGNGSEIVSRRLYEAGLVESATEYNQFLVKNGYDRKLSVGDHEIPSEATYEEMAEILCGMK